MSGMNGIGRIGSMPQNCGMEGMHNNNKSQQAQAKKPNENVKAQPVAVRENTKGNSIDIKI